MKTKRIRNPSVARLHVALDVVAQILCGALLPTKGKIFQDSFSDALRFYSDNNSGKTVLGEIVTPKAECEVCAKGAIIIAHTMRFNVLTVCDLRNQENFQKQHQLPEFSKRQMAEIEVLFEGALYEWSQPLFSQVSANRMTKYFNDNLESLSPPQRLIHIMGLLIKNQGKFIVLRK